MTTTEHLGRFDSDDNTPEMLDSLLAYAIQKGDLEAARPLFASKWWDYRFVHPGHCFYLFADHYRQACEKWRIKFGVASWRHLRSSDDPIFKPERVIKGGSTKLTMIMKPGKDARPKRLLTDQPYRTSLWRSMCFADSYGIPYDRWIDWAFQFAFDTQWKHMPQPANLTGVRTVEFILARWAEDTAELMVIPTDPRFLVDNYIAHPVQDEFQDWLLKLIGARSLPEAALANYLSNEPMICLDRARSVLGDDVTDRAIQRIK